MSREFLKPGSKVRLQDTEYTIESVCGAGSNAVVYRAVYADNIQADQLHRVLIKELFPMDPSGRIIRDASGNIQYEGAQELFALHKESFLHGNSAHLSLLMQEADAVGGNINSYEANNTYYTVLPYNSTKTLMQRMQSIPSLNKQLETTAMLLDALNTFHRNGMLHLDVSPDNVLLIERERSVLRQTSVLLIDYNSVWDLEELSGHEGIYFSVKPPYTAPEVRLRDRRAIGAHSDLFSVTAILYELVTGKALEQNDVFHGLLGDAGKAILDALQGYPQSVSHKLVRILRKGLQIVPTMRYQSCAEMLEDIDDLQNRIERRGVTGSSLWECAVMKLKGKKTLYQDTQIVPNQIRDQLGIEMDALQYVRKNCAAGKNTWIYGDSGFGKTTLLYRLASESMKRFKENAPIYHYLSLSGYNDPDNAHYICDSLTVGIRADDNTRTVEDTRKALITLLAGGDVDITVLLDGFNEIHGDAQTLIREINELNRYPGCHFCITSRSDDAEQLGLTAFTSAVLQPLSPERVSDFLTRNALQIPAQQAVFSLLTNPLMLQMYARSLHIRQDLSDVGSTSVYVPQDGQALIHGFLESLLLSEENRCAGDAEAVRQVQYVLKFFLPMLSYRTGAKQGILTKEELLRFSEENYALLRSRAFSHAFPAYAGESRAILAGVHTGAEWFDLCVQELLVKRFRLLYFENQTFRFSHDMLRDTLFTDGAALEKGFRKYKRIRRLPKAAAVTAAAAIILIVSCVVLTQRVLPAKSEAMALQAKSAFEAGDYYAAAKDAAESVRYLIRPSESDAGVAELRSLLVDKQLRDAVAAPHKEYTIHLPVPYAAYYGTDASGKNAVFGDTSSYWICDNRTGRILQTMKANIDGNPFSDYPRQEGLEYPRIFTMDDVYDDAADNAAEYTEENGRVLLRLRGGSGQDDWLVSADERPRYTYNQNRSAAVVFCDGYFRVHLFDGSFEQQIMAPLGYDFKSFCLSPKGNYLFAIGQLSHGDNDNDEKLFVFDVSAGQIINIILYCQSNPITWRGIAFPNTDEPSFYIFEDDRGTVTKYTYKDETPSEKQKYEFLNENVQTLYLSSDGKTALAVATLENDDAHSTVFLFFDPDTGERIRSFHFEGFVLSGDYSVSEDLKYMAVCEDKKVTLYDINEYMPLYSFKFPGSLDVQQSADDEDIGALPINNVWVASGAERFVCELGYEKLFLFSKQNHGVYTIRELPVPAGTETVWDVTLTEDRIYFGVYGQILSGSDQYISKTFVCNADDLSVVQEIPLAVYGMGDYVCDPGQYLCGRYLLTHHEPDDVVHVYDLADSVEIQHDYWFQDCAVEPDRKLLAARETYSQMQGSVEIQVFRITDKHTIQKLYTYNPGTESIYKFTDDGKYLMIVSQDGSVMLDAETGKEVLHFPNAILLYQNGMLYQVTVWEQMPSPLPHTQLPAMKGLLPYARKVWFPD